MPKKSKKKAGKKSLKRTAAKTAKKKATKKVASRSSGKKSPRGAGRAAVRKLTAEATVMPNICVDNFPADQNDTVDFQGIPKAGVRVIQTSGNNHPFSPVTGTTPPPANLNYTDIAEDGLSGGEAVTVSVGPSPTPYFYTVTGACPGLQGTHSVTVTG